MQSNWNWEELSKTDWTVETQSGVSNPDKLIDGVTYPGTENLSSERASRMGGFWFTVDMQSEKTIAGIVLDYYSMATGTIRVSYSVDNENWVEAGYLDLTYWAFEITNNYVNIIAPIKARYVKIYLVASYSFFPMDVYEVHFYKLK